jgi:predicted RecB family endonuclease
LELEGWDVKGAGVPLHAIPKEGGAGVAIGTYPALLAREAAATRHFLSGHSGEKVVLLPDYLVEQDLPSAYQEVLRHTHARLL